MPAEKTDKRSFFYYLRSGVFCSSPQTLIFTLSVAVLGMMIFAGMARYYVSNGTLPMLSLNVLNEGESRFRAGDPSAALREFESAISVSPDNTDYLFNLGVVYNSMGDKSSAIDAFQHILRFKADHADANYYLGLIYLQQNKLDAAIEYIARSIKFRPSGDTAAPYNDLGVAYARNGDVRNAVDSYQRALVIDPDFSAARENLAALRARTR